MYKVCKAAHACVCTQRLEEDRRVADVLFYYVPLYSFETVSLSVPGIRMDPKKNPVMLLFLPHTDLRSQGHTFMPDFHVASTPILMLAYQVLLPV